MITEVRTLIENCAEEISANNPFFLRASQGTLDEKNFVKYLNSVWYLVTQTEPCLSQAYKKSLNLGSVELAHFFKSKIKEESGHEKWAEADLQKFKFKAEIEKVDDSIYEMLSDIRATIESDPRMYLVYILFNEYFLVLVAPQLLGDIEKNCGYSKNYFSIISNHQELDVHHVEHDLKYLENHFSESEIASIKNCVSKFSSHFSKIFTNLAFQ